MKHYISDGSVRGECGHRHRTLSAAEQCAEHDRRACRRVGGYSDRRALVVEDGLTYEPHYILVCIQHGQTPEECGICTGGAEFEVVAIEE